jgi:HPt (histidine-containing phosphotransfer) domain-containing protein
MITIDMLKEYGADVNVGLSRCMGNEALYLRLVSTIPAEEHFGKLKDSIEAGDLAAAFENAHALKGVTGNLSLTPLYTPLVTITELLRAREETDYSDLLSEIILQKDKLKQLCE